MADVARCICPKDSAGQKIGSNERCPIHGPASKTPAKPYTLTVPDRDLLKSLRIAVDSSADIQRVRQADEDRFKP